MHHGLVLCTVVFFSSPLAYQLPRVTCQKEKLLYFFHHHFGWASSSDWSVYIAFSFGTDAPRFFVFFFLSVRWNSSWCKSRVNPKQHQYYWNYSQTTQRGGFDPEIATSFPARWAGPRSHLSPPAAAAGGPTGDMWLRTAGPSGMVETSESSHPSERSEPEHFYSSPALIHKGREVKYNVASKTQGGITSRMMEQTVLLNTRRLVSPSQAELIVRTE